MPELPEVETIRIGLQSLLPGRKIASITHDWPKGFPNSPGDVEAFIIGAEVVEVVRRAKVLLIELSSKYSLVIHLKMTGQMVFRGDEQFAAGHPNDSLIGALPDRSTRVTITFYDGSRLFFNDQRKFGWMRLMPTAEVPFIDFFQKVGPEPLSDEFTSDILYDRLQRRKNTTIKAAILDQTILAGIGNIYADEGLWGARIHPATRVRHVSRAQVADLHRELVAVLRLSIAQGGSSDKNYVDAQGGRGNYLAFANVFRREGQPCARCGAVIEKSRVAGRGTHTCPVCQRISEE